MLPVLLTFGWFPFFFVFMVLFIARCRDDHVKPPLDEAGRKRLWFSQTARVYIHLACLVPTVLACVSAGSYVAWGLGMTTWGAVFFVIAAALAILGVWAAGFFVVDASYDQEQVCSKQTLSQRRCLAWSAVVRFGFDSFTGCYTLIGSPPSSSVATTVRVAIFSAGIREFEQAARHHLGADRVARALESARAKRARIKKP